MSAEMRRPPQMWEQRLARNQLRVSSGVVSGNATSITTPEVPPGGGGGVEPAPVLPPPGAFIAPSTPTLISSVQGISVVWDGLNSDGDLWPSDTSYVEVHMATSGPTFTVGTATLKGRLARPGGLAVTGLARGTTYYFRLRGADPAGNVTTAGTAASAQPGQITAPDIAANAITANSIVAGTITGWSINSAYLSGGTISGGYITGGTVVGALVSAGTVSGAQISGGTVSGVAITGNTITGGTVSGSLVSGGTVTGALVSGGTVSGALVSGGTVSGGYITGGTVNAAVYTGGSISSSTFTGGTIAGNITATGTVTGAIITGGTVQASVVQSSGGNSRIGIRDNVPLPFATSDAIEFFGGGSSKAQVAYNNGVSAFVIYSDNIALIDYNNAGTALVEISGDLNVIGTATAKTVRPTANLIVFQGYRTTTTAGDVIMRLQSNVTNTGEAKFEVDADGDVKSRTNSYAGFSDARYKDNITPARDYLDDLREIEVVTFNWQGSDQKLLGVTAQQIQTIFPSMVAEDEDGTLSVRYSVFVPMLVTAVQSLADQVDDLRARIEALEA